MDALSIFSSAWMTKLLSLGIKEKYIEKFLQSNYDTNNTDMADLTFTGLTIGRTYEICGQVRQSSANASVYVIFNSGASNTGTRYGRAEFQNQYTGGQTTETTHLNIKFTAESTSLYCYYSRVLGTNASLMGSVGSNKDTTFIQLKECLNLDKVTSF